MNNNHIKGLTDKLEGMGSFKAKKNKKPKKPQIVPGEKFALFKIGDLAWVRMAGYPWWPSVVNNAITCARIRHLTSTKKVFDESLAPELVTRQKRKDTILAYFLDTNSL